MKITREIIQANASLTDELKSELIGLLDAIAGKEEELENLRKTKPSDSDEVVSKVDMAKFRAATADLEKLKNELAVRQQDRATSGGVTIFEALFGI